MGRVKCVGRTGASNALPTAPPDAPPTAASIGSVTANGSCVLFEEGDKVIARYDRFLYSATVLKVKEPPQPDAAQANQPGGPVSCVEPRRYHVHWEGWSKKWDSTVKSEDAFAWNEAAEQCMNAHNDRIEHGSSPDDKAQSLSPVKRKRVAAANGSSAKPNGSNGALERQMGAVDRSADLKAESGEPVETSKRRRAAVVPPAQTDPAAPAALSEPVKPRPVKKKSKAGPQQVCKRSKPVTMFKTNVMCSPGSIEGCGAGFARGGQAIQRDARGKVSVVVKVGSWIGDTRDGQQYDLRHLEDRKDLPGSRVCVPGWRGVRVAWDQEDNHWSSSYAGKYVAMKKDRGGAHWRFAGRCDTVEEAAKLHDEIEVTTEGPENAETNYPVSNYTAAQAAQSNGEDGVKVSKSVVFVAMRLAELELEMPDAVVEGTTKEWEEFKINLRKVMTTPPCKGSVKLCARMLKWAGEQIKPEARHTAWDDGVHEEWCQACDNCTEPGGQKSHWADSAADDISLVERSKSYGDFDSIKYPSSYQFGSRTLYALFWALNDELMCQKAFRAIEDGRDGPGAALVEHKTREKKLASWADRLEPPPTHVRRAAASRVRKAYAPPKPRQMFKPMPKGLRVIIVGAGVSGLKAARDLQAMGAAEVTLLEARDRIGGRMHTFDLSVDKDGSVPVDLGATFICGTSEVPPVNPMYELAVDTFKLTIVPKERTGKIGNKWYMRDGSTVSLDLAERAETAYNGLLARIGVQGEGTKVEADYTVREAVDQDLREHPLPDDVKEMVKCYLSDLYVADMSECSLRGMVSEGYDGNHELVNGGYTQVINRLAQGYTLPESVEQPFEGPLNGINLRQEVTHVELNEDGKGVKVTSVPLNQGGDHGAASVHEADAVIVTLPLGVLKAGNVTFDPPLPSNKCKAIERLGMGTENRVAMLFENVFWPTENHFLRPVFGNYTFANMNALLDNKVLCAWVRPTAIDIVEKMSDSEMMADVESVLRKLFSNYETPLNYQVTRWKSDKYSRGSYSFVKAGATKSDYGMLSRPITGDPELDEGQYSTKGTDVGTRLYFAGEATSTSDSYTVHGAYMSGRREAAKLAKWWREHQSALFAGDEDETEALD